MDWTLSGDPGLKYAWLGLESEPISAWSSSSCRPAHAMCRALLRDHVRYMLATLRVLIGVRTPMPCPIHIFIQLNSSIRVTRPSMHVFRSLSYYTDNVSSPPRSWHDVGLAPIFLLSVPPSLTSGDPPVPDCPIRPPPLNPLLPTASPNPSRTAGCVLLLPHGAWHLRPAERMLCQQVRLARGPRGPGQQHGVPSHARQPDRRVRQARHPRPGRAVRLLVVLQRYPGLGPDCRHAFSSAAHVRCDQMACAPPGTRRGVTLVGLSSAMCCNAMVAFHLQAKTRGSSFGNRCRARWAGPTSTATQPPGSSSRVASRP